MTSAANWSGNTLPVSTDIIVIGGNFGEVHLDTDFTIEGQLTIGADAYSGMDTLVIDSGVTLTTNSGVGYTAINITRAGSLVNNGTLENTTGTINGMEADFTNSAGAVFNHHNSFWFTGGVTNDGLWNISRTPAGPARITFNGGDFNNNSTINLISGGEIQIQYSTSSVQYESWTNQFNNNASGVISGSGKLTIGYGSYPHYAQSTLNNYGSIAIEPSSTYQTESVRCMGIINNYDLIDTTNGGIDNTDGTINNYGTINNECDGLVGGTVTGNPIPSPSCDNCPDDPNKVEPGICGCGVPDTDPDSDGTPNCNDNCPNIYNPDQEDNDDNNIGDACECEGDFEPDGDVDGRDLAQKINAGGSNIDKFADNFGRIDCQGF